MREITSIEPVAHVIRREDIEAFEVFGPTVEYLTQPRDGEPCIMRGTIPPHVSVPLHSHADPETFMMIFGVVEGLSHSADGFEWIEVRPGDIFHVPGGAMHAFRNQTGEPAIMLIVSTDRIGRFFQEVGSPVRDGPQVRPFDPFERFLQASKRYGYWNASPEENARVGIVLTAP